MNHEQNLTFLQAVVDVPESTAEAVFTQHKRDLRYALWDLLKPKEGLEELLQAYKDGNPSERKELLPKIFQHFMPNPPYKEILRQHKQGKTPPISAQTAESLNKFHRGPRKAQVNLLFDVLNPQDTALAADLLDRLRPFGREIAHQLQYINMMAESSNQELSKAALQLIPHIPDGIEKSIMTYWAKMADEDLRFTALNALQAACGLNPDLLFEMFQPILLEYERLQRSQGDENELWMEVNMIKTILAKNGGSGRVWMVGKSFGFKK